MQNYLLLIIEYMLKELSLPTVAEELRQQSFGVVF